MSSVDIKSSRGIKTIIGVAAAIGGAGTALITQQALLSNEISHVVTELRIIGKNLESSQATVNAQGTTLAEHEIRISSVEKAIEKLQLLSN